MAVTSDVLHNAPRILKKTVASSDTWASGSTYAYVECFAPEDGWVIDRLWVKVTADWTDSSKSIRVGYGGTEGYNTDKLLQSSKFNYEAASTPTSMMQPEAHADLGSALWSSCETCPVAWSIDDSSSYSTAELRSIRVFKSIAGTPDYTSGSMDVYVRLIHT